MAKMYQLTFSVSDEMIAGEEGTKKSIKEAEIMMLKNMFQIASAHEKDLGKALECRDCMSQLDNLSGEEILFTKQDLDYLKVGFEKTEGNRPAFWVEKCGDLLEQINNPKETDTESPKAKK